MIIGLTGGIATGKSTVTRILRDHGQAIVDSDLIARQVVVPAQPAYNRIVEYFGQEILLANGELDRGKLGQRIFSNPSERAALEAITHPAIFAEIDEQVKATHAQGYRHVFLDVPLLIETAMHKQVDKVVLVYVRPELQLQRLVSRDQLSKEEAVKRINAQMSIEEKRDYADFIIDNNGSLEALENQVRQLLKQLGEL